MAKDLLQLVESVVDEKSFIAFLGALGEDFAEEHQLERKNPGNPYETGALGWQNGSIDQMLESAVAWATDCAPVSDTNVWRRCAEIIFAGKHYE